MKLAEKLREGHDEYYIGAIKNLIFKAADTGQRSVHLKNLSDYALKWLDNEGFKVSCNNEEPNFHEVSW